MSAATFTAQYASGTCADCESRIQPGDEISRTVDGGYTHAHCPATDLEQAAAKPVCPVCQMAKPCFCD